MYEWMKKKKCRAAKWTGEAAEIDFIVLLWNCSSWKRNRIQATCNRSLHLLPPKMLSTSSPTFLLRGGQGRREGGGQQRLHLEKEQLLLLFIASAFLTIFFYPLRLLLLFLLEKRRKKNSGSSGSSSSSAVSVNHVTLFIHLKAIIQHWWSPECVRSQSKSPHK